MNWSRSVSSWTAEVLLLWAALAVSGCACEPEAFALTGESTKLKKDDPLPGPSAIFDGNRVSLRGLRGETLGVLVNLRDGREHSLELVLPEHVARASSFELGFVEVREPSTSMYGESRGRGRYPDPLTPVSGAVHTDQGGYFDVVIRRDAPAGTHRGELVLDGKRFVVELRVEPLSIELETEPLVWAFYLPKEIAHAHGVAEDDSPELIELELRYHQLFREHGVLLAADLPPERFPPRRRFVHGVRYWPVALDLSSDRAIARDVRAWLALFAGSSVVPFAIPVDEPQTPADKQRAAHVARVIGEAGGGHPRLLRAVTDRVDDDVYDGVIDVWFSPGDIPERARQRRVRGERFWTYNGRPPSAGSMIIDTNGVALRTWGWIAYLYDVELWYAWEALYFSDRYNRGGPTDLSDDPITFDERSKGGQDYGNGDGLLAYPGPRPSLRLKALRRGLSDRLLLRALDRCGGRAEALAIARGLIPRALGEAGPRPSWPADERAWEIARGRVLDALGRRSCRG
jgi:hypothetical protein